MDTKHNHSLPNFADLLLDAVFMVDVSGKIVYVSAACQHILGYTPEEMIGQTMMDFILPEDRARTREEAAHIMSGGQRVGFENHYIRKDGGLARIMWSARWSEADQLRIGVARDVTARRHVEALQSAMYAISEAAHEADDLAALFREVHRIIAGLVPLTGFAVALHGKDTGQLSFPYWFDHAGGTEPAHETEVHRLCADVIASRQPARLPAQPPGAGPASHLPAGDYESWLAVPLLSHNRTMGAVIVKSHPGMRDTEKEAELLQFVSKQVAAAIERKQLHAALLKMAQFDELTGLPNRRLFHDRIGVALARAQRRQGRLALLYIDLNDFKLVNDSLGHAMGDLLLQEVARRLRRCVRNEDTVARLGGDEFVVLLEQVQLLRDAEIVAEKIRNVVGEPITLGERSVRMLPSVGIALYPDHGDRVEQLLKHADEAMYAAKKSKARMAEPVPPSLEHSQ
jgi:diguanylate cyclase (GGDEF)-like protein/PAS domain S-box-containing protein